MNTLIKNGRIGTAVDETRVDILIEDETISSTRKKLLCGNVIGTGMTLDMT